MKATKYLAMAAAALAFAACSSDELASVADRNANGLRPVEFSTVVKNQTRAGQIYNDEAFATIYMKTTGTFYAEDGTKVVDPSLLLTKSGSTWTYKVNGAEEASTLYWPLESYDNTFQAWYYDGGATQGALNNKTADLDAVGAYATHSSTDEGNNVALNFYHAVSKAEFKVKVHEKTAEGAHKVKVDVKAVCLHNVNFKTSGTPAYTLPTSAAQMGAFAVDGTSTRDLVTAIPDAYVPAWVTEESAVTPVGSLMVMPQAIAAVEDFSTTTWSKPYISVLAQVRIDNAGNAAIFPKEAGADDYAWIALPLPADFTQMQAHHKYIFTLNFRNDALGRVDRDQNPNDDDEPSGPDTDDLVPEEDEGNPIVEPAHSGFALDVTVTEVYDFEEGGDYDVSNNAPSENIVDLGTLTADYVAQNGDVLTGTLGENVKISIAGGASVKLRNAIINGTNEEDYSWAGITCVGDAVITLEGANTTIGFYDEYPGIYVPDGSTLTIQGSGSLTASSNGFGSGIGSGYNMNGGNIVINGGTIIATGGGYGAAGIGSTISSTCGTIEINGGIVTAEGGEHAASIGSGWGSGYASSCGNITITSGVTSVTATKGLGTPNNIGAGEGGTCGTVTIGGVEGAITTSPYIYPVPTPDYYSGSVGQVITSDGGLYDNVAAATAANKTAVAMIAYVGSASDCAHGLAIALSDYYSDWSMANFTAASTTAIMGGTWRLPTTDDWQYMAIGCGSDQAYNSSHSISSLSDVWLRYDYINDKLTTAAGSEATIAVIDTDVYYWTGTTMDEDSSYAFTLITSSGLSGHKFDGYIKSEDAAVRACFAF